MVAGSPNRAAAAATLGMLPDGTPPHRPLARTRVCARRSGRPAELEGPGHLQRLEFDEHRSPTVPARTGDDSSDVRTAAPARNAPARRSSSTVGGRFMGDTVTPGGSSDQKEGYPPTPMHRTLRPSTDATGRRSTHAFHSPSSFLSCSRRRAAPVRWTSPTSQASRHHADRVAFPARHIATSGRRQRVGVVVRPCRSDAPICCEPPPPTGRERHFHRHRRAGHPGRRQGLYRVFGLTAIRAPLRRRRDPSPPTSEGIGVALTYFFIPAVSRRTFTAA